MQQGPSILEQREKESQAKYRQIADILRERILRGRYKPGETIPSYPRLRELFEVSDITVRKAVALLVNEKLLRMERGRGKGFFVMPPVPARGSGRRLHRLCILPVNLPQSDDPAIQKGITAAVEAEFGSVFLLPDFADADSRLRCLRSITAAEAADGFLINGQLFASDREAAGVTEYFDSCGMKYVVIYSCECRSASEFFAAGRPGVFMNERDALRRALHRARSRGNTRLLFLGIDGFSVRRSIEVARRLDLAREFEFVEIILDELQVKNLFHSFERVLEEAVRPGTTVVLEGSNLPLSYFDSLLAARRLRPGRDISCFFFEHYCNLEPVFFSKYSSISRPYFDLGFKAGELLRRMVASGVPGETITLSAAFNDLGTI